MKRGPLLLELLLVALAAHGLSPQTLDPWRGWVVFKQFVRSVAEVPDPGVSVQVTHDEQDVTTSLVFLRQVADVARDELVPVGGIVCEFVFPQRQRIRPAGDQWSFDAPTFDRFVDLVEEDPGFQDLVVSEPLASAVYWLGA